MKTHICEEMNTAKNIVIKIIVEIARLLLGVTFIFSGFVKSVDPLGTAYKIEDYMTNFGLVDLHPLALPLSIFLCAGELCLGIFMLFGLYRKWVAYLLFIVLLFMTPLTLYLAIANPVKDCGCFGDALIISNWATFYKNIILLLCSIFTLVWNQRITNLFTGKFYWLVALYTIVCGILFCIYNYMNEPMLDFRPYKIGANIPELMTVDEDKKAIYENILIYEKDGIKKEFTEDNYPWQDSTWHYVEVVSKMLKEGEEPLVKDFTINRLYLSDDKSKIEGEEDITTEMLADSNYTFLMISSSLEDAREEFFSKFEDVNNYANEHRYNFYCLTSSPSDNILKLEKENITNFAFCQADERTLKTIIRSNPGLLLIKNGTIINKWSDKDVPNENLLNKPVQELAVFKMPNKKEEDKKNLLNILLIFIVPIAFIKILDVILYQRKS